MSRLPTGGCVKQNMIDLKFVRNNIDLVEKNCISRNVKIDFQKLAELYDSRYELQQKIEAMRAERRKKSAKKPTPEEIAKIKESGRLLKEAEAEFAEKDAQLNALSLQIPNLNHETTPIGKDETEDVVVRHVGTKPEFAFKPKEHFEVASVVPMMDLERGAKASGSRFYYLKDKLAILERAIMQFAIDRTVAKGFQLVLPPIMVKEDAMFATGFFPADKNEIYSVNPDDDKLFLVGTSEVPLIYMHSGEILKAENLPLKYVAITPCFRRESGSYGKDTRGMFRVHQFYKVEMVVFCRPEDSWKLHDELLAHEESILQELGMHYRVLNVCSGDLGFPAAKKYDCEAWFAGQGKYREVTSTSNTTDYQARRAKIRIAMPDGTKCLAHTLNGTVTSDRPLLAIIENNQTENGDVKIPECLVRYTGFDIIKAVR